LLDVGHNPAGAWALRSVLTEMEEEKQVLRFRAARSAQDDKVKEFKTLIFGCLRDKAITELAQILFPLFDRVLLTPVDSPRSAAIEDLATAAAATGAEYETCIDEHQALKRAQEITPEAGLIVGTGSVYLVGALRRELTA